MAKKSDTVSTTPSPSEALQPVGVTGASIWRGTMGEEYLPALKPPKCYKIYREMQDDPVISVLLNAITLPLLAAEFTITPADEESQEAQDVADWMWSALQNMTEYTWRQHTVDMLSMLSYGWAWGEVVCEKDVDGRLGLATVDPRSQDSLYEWHFDDRQRVEGMEQQDPISGAHYTIPAWKSVHMAWMPQKRNPEGRSLLRSVYRPWYFRKNLETIEGIGIERDLAGLPVITLPYGYTKADSDAAAAMVKNLRNDEEAGIVLPGPRIVGKDMAPWKLELMSGGQKQYDTGSVISRYNKQILMVFFAQFLELGMDKVGTQALVAGSHDFFSLALKAVQQCMLEHWNRQLIPLLCNLNGIDEAVRPSLDWADPGKADITGLGDLISKMTNAGIITPEPGIEDHIRALAGLPDRPEGIGEGPRTVVMPQIPGQGQPAPQRFRQRRYKDIEGIAARTAGPGTALRLTNEYQAELLRMYDDWSAELANDIADRQPTTPESCTAIIDLHMGDLADRMHEMGRRRIREAWLTGMRGMEPDAKALRRIAEAQARNDGYIDTSLIPDIRERAMAQVPDIIKPAVKEMADRQHHYDMAGALLMLGVLEGVKGRVDGYVGEVWRGCFEGAGIWQADQNVQRAAQGLPSQRVKWQLDPDAQHCKAADGRHGCEQLAGVYDQWDDMPTVPAGDVTCLGNCRCSILVEEGGQWVGAI